MIDHYVVAKEKRLYAIALVFSIVIWFLLVLGIGAAIVAAAGIGSGNKTEPLGESYGTPNSQMYDDTLTTEENVFNYDSEYDGTEYDGTEYDGTEYDGTEYDGTEYDQSDYLGTEYDQSALTDQIDDSMLDYAAMEYAPAKTSASDYGVTIAVFIIYILLFVFIILFSHIIAVGHLMGNGVRVSEKQFPELWATFVRTAKSVDVKKLPAFYLVEGGGILNAFATRLFTRNYVALYADLAELFYEGDEEPVSFVIAHELIHVKRNHMFKGLITLPSAMIPFLHQAWKRACEYTCDAGAAMIERKGAERGLSLLAAGKKLSSRMSVDAYLESFKAEKSAWKRFSELFASHPYLPKRIAAIRLKNQG